MERETETIEHVTRS